LVKIPSSPNEVRNASKRASVESMVCKPASAPTYSMLRTADENEPNARPDPCVAVPMAPAMVWASMSPWFRNDRPAAHSCGTRSCNEVPAPTTAVALTVSASITPESAAASIITSSVHTSGVNECPLPTTRTVPPRRVASATAS
jgi:hypothetical protein